MKKGGEKKDSGANPEQFAPCAQPITLCSRAPTAQDLWLTVPEWFGNGTARDLVVGLRDGWENKPGLIYGSVPWGWNSSSPLVEKFCTHTQTQNRLFFFGFWLFLSLFSSFLLQNFYSP